MIDEKKLIEDIHKYFYKKIEELTGEVYDDSPVTKEERELYTMNKEICGIIKAQPIIDAVEVVRCEKCKWNRPYLACNGTYQNQCTHRKMTYEMCFPNEHFCGYGERRSDEAD